MFTWDVHFRLRIDHGDPGLVRATARAQALADVVREIPLPPRVQQRLHRLHIVRAVQGAAALDALAESPGGGTGVPPAEVDENEIAIGYEVMERLASLLESDPQAKVTRPFLLDLHRWLMPTASDTPDDARWRTSASPVGEYLPPAPPLVPKLLDSFFEWLESTEREGWDPVVQAVMAHFYLVSIQPFADGNGRTARTLESFLLYRRTPGGGGLNTRGFYLLANFYGRERSAYVAWLNRIRQDPEADATPFVRFAAGGLVAELESLSRVALQQVQILAFRDFARGYLARQESLRAGSRSRLLRLVLGLLEEQMRSHSSGVSLADWKQGKGLLAELYAGKSPGQLRRDLAYLRDHRLIVVDQGLVSAHLALMNAFTAPRPR